MEIESKLVPILREGIEIVKMIFFKQLQEYLVKRFPEREKNFINKLAGAVINQYFGIVHQDEKFVRFAVDNGKDVETVLREVSQAIETLRIPLTDALRIMVLCDYQEGIDSSHLLEKARGYGILLIEREMPLPNKFIELVRKIGEAYGLLTPPLPAD